MAKRSRKPIQKMPAASEPSPKLKSFAGLLFCFFLSGAAALIYQVLWIKALGLIFGHTAYALATVLAVFMGGLAAGSEWLGQWSESRRHMPSPQYSPCSWADLPPAANGSASGAKAGRNRWQLTDGWNSPWPLVEPCR